MPNQVHNGRHPGVPKIKFPCKDYPIKVVGHKTEDYSQWVINSVQRWAPDLDLDSIEVIDSRNHRFQSVSLMIYAQSMGQLQAIHTHLISSGRVKIVI
jgi:putative lipoic acid-binding regulatory protein